MKKIEVIGREISIASRKEEDFISITDIAKYKNPDAPADVVKNWLRNRNTIELLGLWEKLYNPDFKLVEFDQFRNDAGFNHFVLSPKKWITTTNAIGLQSKSGKYGGTFAHKDIAFEFASWVSVEFKLYLIKEFQRLKEDETKSLDWDIKRSLTKINYRIHTDAIKGNLIPSQLNPKQIQFVYASEADILNMALFGVTAKQWRETNPDKKGNVRDYANVTQLVCLANLENINALLIKEKIKQTDRLIKLNQIAIEQMKLLTIDTNKNIAKLKRKVKSDTKKLGKNPDKLSE